MSWHNKHKAQHQAAKRQWKFMFTSFHRFISTIFTELICIVDAEIDTFGGNPWWMSITIWMSRYVKNV